MFGFFPHHVFRATERFQGPWGKEEGQGVSCGQKNRRPGYQPWKIIAGFTLRFRRPGGPVDYVARRPGGPADYEIP